MSSLSILWSAMPADYVSQIKQEEVVAHTGEEAGAGAGTEAGEVLLGLRN